MRDVGALIVALLLSTTAGAAALPAVARHPLVVVGGSDEDARSLGKLLDAELDRRDLHVVRGACVSQFLATRPDASCRGQEGCLAKLAESCSATRALYVTVYPYRPKMVFTGKLVRADGLVERSVSNFEFARPPGKFTQAAVREGLRRVLTEGLKLESLDLEPLVAQAPAAEATPVHGPPVVAESAPAPSSTTLPAPTLAPPAASPEGRSGPSALRIASFVTAGAGVVALGVGVGLAIAANSDRNAYEKTLDPDKQRPDTPASQSVQASLRDKSTAVDVLLIGGAALVVTGSVLFLLEPRSAPSTRVEMALVRGGAAVVLNGRF